MSLVIGSLDMIPGYCRERELRVPVLSQTSRRTYVRTLFDVRTYYDRKRPYVQTLNGRLPLERSLHGRQTPPKRVSDDSRRFIFRRRKKMFDDFFFGKIPASNQKRAVLEEPRIFQRCWQIGLEKRPPTK